MPVGNKNCIAADTGQSAAVNEIATDSGLTLSDSAYRISGRFAMFMLRIIHAATNPSQLRA